MRLADDRLPAAADVLLPELWVVAAEHSDEPLHRPTEERGAEHEVPVPGEQCQDAEAGGEQVVGDRQLPLTASQKLGPLQRLVDDIANRKVVR